MEAFYPQILAVHVGAVSLSGSLFLTRAFFSNVLGASWTMTAPVRYLSYSIDTILLTAALMLMTITHQGPFMTPWLTVKVLLLAAYVVLGSYALKRGRTRSVRLLCSIAAITLLFFVVSIALSHDPWGVLSWI